MPTYHFEQFFAKRTYWDWAFSPDGREVAYVVDTSGQLNLWRQERCLAWPYQLTAFEEQRVTWVAWAPEQLLFLADYQGDENHQIYTLPPQGGWPRRLTERDDVQHTFNRRCLSPDGRWLAFTSNEREPSDKDVYVMDLTTGERRRVYQGEGFAEASSLSPDGRFVVVTQARTIHSADVLLADVRDGSVRTLLPARDYTGYAPGPWTPDGRGFYLLSNEEREFTGVAFFDVAAGRWDWVATPDHDVEALDLSPDGRWLAYSLNVNGSSRVQLLEVATGTTHTLDALPRGVLQGELRFAPDGQHLGLILSTPRWPAELYVVDLKARQVERITHSFYGGIDPDDLAEPEDVFYTTFDGRSIHALYYRPSGSGPFPAVVVLHGGPNWQEKPCYFGLYQYLVHHGIAVFAPNFRGSIGYGKSFERLIWRDWGGGELRDIEAGVDYLCHRPEIDPRRIGVFGGSFGGFATLTALTRLPERFVVGVDICGPSNLVTFARTVPPFWKTFMATWLGDPDADRDFLLERSPITRVDQIRAPLLVIQGAKDPRVVKAESDQMVEAIRARGGTVEYIVYEDEGHGLSKRRNQLSAFRACAEFLERYLGIEK